MGAVHSLLSTHTVVFSMILLFLFFLCHSATMSWVEYIPGDLNLIITVPHNGKEKPEGLEDRKDGYRDNEGLCHFPGTDNPEEMDSDDEECEVSLGADLYTRSIAKKVSKKLVELSHGKKPHIIVSSIHRSKMDPNRNLRREPKEDHWLNGRIMSFMAKLLRLKVNLMDLDFFWISTARRMLATEPSWDTPFQE